MPNIRHLLSIKATPQSVYQALTTQKGLSEWWTTQVKASGKKGDPMEFGFSGGYKKSIRLVDAEPNRSVNWEMIDGTPEWLGTTFHFTLEPNGDGIIVHFEHNDWKAYTDLFAQCTYDWGRFLASLKNYLESGKGAPFQATTMVG